MKKILFTINTMGRGGAERALLELLNRLDGRGYEVSLYVLLGQGELAGQLPPFVRLLNKNYQYGSVLDKAGRRSMAKTVVNAFFRNGNYIKKLGSVVRNFAVMRKSGRMQKDKLFWRVLSDGAPRFSQTWDLAVSWLEGGAVYYTADHVNARKKAAFIHINYESAGYTPKMDQGCWREFDRIFAVSDETRKCFLAVYPEYAKKVSVFSNIIDKERIRRMAARPGGFSDSYGGLRLLTVGRLTYQKAFDIAMEAMRLIKDAGYRARWYVLGEGDQRHRLEKRVEALGLQEDFLLLGAVENPYPYYLQADVYVHATRFEGRSIVLQEAQTLGCAVVASNCNGNRQQIIDGQDGLLCDLTPQAVADSVISLLKDKEKREKLGRAAYEKEMPAGGDMEKLLKLLM